MARYQLCIIIIIIISDTARNRTHNLFRPKRELIPLSHSDGFINMNYLIMMWKVGNKNCIKASDVNLITFLTRWRDDYIQSVVLNIQG